MEENNKDKEKRNNIILVAIIFSIFIILAIVGTLLFCLLTFSYKKDKKPIVETIEEHNNEHIEIKRKDIFLVNKDFLLENGYNIEEKNDMVYYVKGNVVITLFEDDNNELYSLVYTVYNIDSNYSPVSDLEILSKFLKPDVLDRYKELEKPIKRYLSTSYKDEDVVENAELNVSFDSVRISINYNQGDKNKMTYILSEEYHEQEESFLEKAVITDFDEYFDYLNDNTKKLFGVDITKYKDSIAKEFPNIKDKEFLLSIENNEEYFSIRITNVQSLNYTAKNENEYNVHLYTNSFIKSNIYTLFYNMNHPDVDSSNRDIIKKNLKQDLENLKNIINVDLTGELDSLLEHAYAYLDDPNCFYNCNGNYACVEKCPESSIKLGDNYDFSYHKIDKGNLVISKPKK